MTLIRNLIRGAKNDDSTLAEDNAAHASQLEAEYREVMRAIATMTRENQNEVAQRIARMTSPTDNATATAAFASKVSALGPVTPPAPASPFEFFERSTSKYVETLSARRDVLQAQISKDSEELWQINVVLNGMDAARTTVVTATRPDHVSDGRMYAEASKGNVPDDVVDAMLADAAEASILEELSRDIEDAKRVSAEPVKAGIPPGIYYSTEHDNFYTIDGHNGRGNAFHTKWFARRSEFPGDPREPVA